MCLPSHLNFHRLITINTMAGADPEFCEGGWLSDNHTHFWSLDIPHRQKKWLIKNF
jgi:hypothetical protein